MLVMILLNNLFDDKEKKNIYKSLLYINLKLQIRKIQMATKLKEKCYKFQNWETKVRLN